MVVSGEWNLPNCAFDICCSEIQIICAITCQFFLRHADLSGLRIFETNRHVCTESRVSPTFIKEDLSRTLFSSWRVVRKIYFTQGRVLIRHTWYFFRNTCTRWCSLPIHLSHRGIFVILISSTTSGKTNTNSLVYLLVVPWRDWWESRLFDVQPDGRIRPSASPVSSDRQYKSPSTHFIWHLHPADISNQGACPPVSCPLKDNYFCLPAIDRGFVWDVDTFGDGKGFHARWAYIVKCQKFIMPP